MDKTQGDQIIELLDAILGELSGLRADFAEFTGDTPLKETAEDIIDAVTGAIGGKDGTSLEDLSNRITGGIGGARCTSLEDLRLAIRHG